MEPKKKKIIEVLVSAVVVLILYIFLHEMGHCIVAIACGATITDFSILTAHMSSVGGNYTNLSDLWLNANGALFPLIVTYVYMLFYDKKRENSFYRILSYFIAIIPACSLLAWVFIPIVYMTGNAPVGDDVTKFLYNFSSGYHPIYVSIAALLLIAVSVTIMVKKQILHNAMAETKRK